jgi:hypothetical protein
LSLRFATIAIFQCRHFGSVLACARGLTAPAVFFLVCCFVCIFAPLALPYLSFPIVGL